jgi:uncharacterized membrane protein YhiD involved in acid resistance
VAAGHSSGFSFMRHYHEIGDLISGLSPQISLQDFFINLVLSALLAFVLGRVYVKVGHTLSNRELFARNFVVLAMTTMLIITIVKSSLALSLGLVGALSIIRFRAAIKEPEELNYLFLAISLGLGFGAGQTLLTSVAFIIIVALLVLRHFVQRTKYQPNFYLTITSPTSARVDLPRIMDVLNQHASTPVLKRFDEGAGTIEASFHVQFDKISELDACNKELRSLSDAIRISYLEERGIGA